jgi:hypothetical protein
MQLHKFLAILSLLLLINCVVFEQIDRLPEPAVHAIMIPITLGLPLII